MSDMKGCGGNCACAKSENESSVDQACPMPAEKIVLDKDGKCPCGKTLSECCHKDQFLQKEDNDALHELCDTHNGQHVCDIDSDLIKTAP